MVVWTLLTPMLFIYIECNVISVSSPSSAICPNIGTSPKPVGVQLEFTGLEIEANLVIKFDLHLSTHISQSLFTLSYISSYL